MGLRRLTGVIVAICSLLAAGTAQAQEADPPHRPKIALVLSGGGALGLAHVGVIAQLEALGVRPDLIVGTSMGAVVGGAYASGYSAAELRRIIEDLNWAAIFDARPDRTDLPYRRKRDQLTFPVKVALKVNKGGIGLPEAAIGDQRLMSTLRSLIGGRDLAPNFDALTIPFRAVATDIETGQPVVIDQGSLASAMRASMAVPGVFAPERVRGKVLVDGGLSDNIPIDVALAQGADIIIVSQLQTRLKTQREINNALDAAGQSVTLLILVNEREQLAKLRPQDILIKVGSQGLNGASFDRARELMDLGQAAAAAAKGQLAPLGKADRPLPGNPDLKSPPIIDFVAVDNGSRLSDELIQRRFTDLMGKPLDRVEVNHRVGRLYALGAFDRVDYELADAESRTGLLVHALRRQRESANIRLGLTIENDFQGTGDYRLSADYRTPALDKNGSEARLEAVLGDRLRLSAEYFKILGPDQTWFVAPRVNLASSNVPVFDSHGYKTGDYRASYREVEVDIGRQFGDLAEMRVGVQLGSGKAKGRQGVVAPDLVPIEIGQVVAQAGLDTLDDALFPSRGISLSGRWELGLRDLGAKSDFHKADGQLLAAQGFGRNTLLLQIQGGSVYQGEAPIESRFRVGGLFSLSGFRSGELSGEAYGAVRLIYRRRLDDTRALFFGVPLYAGASLEAGDVWSRADQVNLGDLKIGGSVYLAADTVMGPVYLGYGQSGSDRRAVYLFVGRPF